MIYGKIVEVEIEFTHGRRYPTYTTVVEVNSNKYRVVHKYGDRAGDTIDIAINKYNSQYQTRKEYLILSFASSGMDIPFLLFSVVSLITWLVLYFRDWQIKKKYEAGIYVWKEKLLGLYGTNNSLPKDSFDIYNAECVRRLDAPIPVQIEWCLKNLDCNILAGTIPCLQVSDGIPEFIAKTLEYRNKGLTQRWIVCCEEDKFIYCIEIDDERIYSVSRDGFGNIGQAFVKEYDGFIDYVADSLNIG